MSMQMGGMYLRLAAARLRLRKGQFLLLFAVTATACAIALSALAVRGAASVPWDRLFAATNGAHVQVSAASLEAARAATTLPGIEQTTDAIGRNLAALGVDGSLLRVELVRAPARERMRVDRPVLVAGRWAHPGGEEIVLESTFADALGIRVGDHVQVGDSAGVGGRRALLLRVAGTAATADRGTYPEFTPGAAWLDAATFDRLDLDRNGSVDPSGPEADWSVGLRLDDPATADAVVARLGTDARWRDLQAWTAERTRLDTTAVAEVTRAVVLAFAMLLLVAAVLLVFTLLGSRAVSDARQLALLQVAGVTPGQLSLLLAVEHAIIALAGAACGAVAAQAVGPWLAAAAGSGLGTVPPEVSVAQVALVVGVALLAGMLAAALATVRAGRVSLAVVVRGGDVRRSRLAGLAAAAAAPVWVTLGVKDVLVRRGRMLIIVASLALAMMTTIVIIGADASVAAADRSERQLAAGVTVATPLEELPDLPPDATVAPSGVLTLLTVLQALLGLVALANLVAAGLMSTRERLRELGVLDAVGCSPGQLVAAAATGHGLLAVPAALLGIPLGFGLLAAITSGVEGTVYPSPVAVVLVVVTVAAAAAAAAAIPAVAVWRLSPSRALATE